MIRKLIQNLKCHLGRHRLVTYPFISVATISHRQVIITKTRCIHCAYCNEL